MSEENDTIIALAAEIVAAHVSNNSVAVSDISNLIQSVHTALRGLGASAPEAKLEPAVSIRASVKPDHIVCLEDGLKFKMLRRHLDTYHRMTVDEYRAKWGLPENYPVVAPNYAKQRRALALEIGLGRKAGKRKK